MALSTISTINFTNKPLSISGPTIVYENFAFPTGLNVGLNTITTHTYNYSGGSGSTIWKNGKYLMMSKYSNGVNAAWNMFTLSNSNFFMTGVNGTVSHQYLYNSATDSVSQGSNFSYTRAAYSTTGVYIGGTTNTSQRVSTTYNGSTISFGEYFEVRFPFVGGFIFEKLFISLANNNTFGPRDIRVLGSDDGITWTQVHFQTHTATYTQNVFSQVINLTTNTQAYKSHRVIFEKNNNGNTIIIGQSRIEGKAVIII